MFPRGEFAGIAPSGRPVISGGTTGLEVLEIALANWPVPESTKRGTPPGSSRKSAGCMGPRPPLMQNTFESSARAPIGSILMKISLATPDTTTDPVPLFSAPMGRQFLDIESEDLDIKAIQG